MSLFGLLIALCLSTSAFVYFACWNLGSLLWLMSWLKLPAEITKFVGSGFGLFADLSFSYLGSTAVTGLGLLYCFFCFTSIALSVLAGFGLLVSRIFSTGWTSIASSLATLAITGLGTCFVCTVYSNFGLIYLNSESIFFIYLSTEPGDWGGDLIARGGDSLFTWGTTDPCITVELPGILFFV